MPITLTCAVCERRIFAPERAAGKSVRCRGCNGVNRVPMAEAPPRFDDDALADSMGLDAPKAPPARSVSLTDLYADSLKAPSPPSRGAAASRRPAGGPHQVARFTAQALDWLMFVVTGVATIAAGVFAMVVWFTVPAPWPTEIWSGEGLLILAIPVLWAVYLVERLGTSVVLAIFDIEEHLSRR
jgi:hypothetical protein